MKSAIIFSLAALAAVAGYMWTAGGFDTAQFNYKVAIAVEYQGRQYIGESVWQVRAWAPRIIAGQVGLHTDVRGEAIPIEVDGLGVLYALKRSASNVSTSSFGDFPTRCDLPGNRHTIYETIDAMQALFRGPCLASDADPVLARLLPGPPYLTVIPTVMKGNGPCTELCIISIVTTRTDDPITTGLVDQFAWLAAADSPTEVIVGPEQLLRVGETNFLRQDFSTE